MVNQRSIDANLDKIKAMLKMKASQTVKEVQHLTRRLVALNYFVSKATARCLPFFQGLRKAFKFEWAIK